MRGSDCRWQSDEHEASRGSDKSGKGARAASILLARWESFGDTERNLPRDFTGVGVYREEPLPWRFDARKISDRIPACVLGGSAEAREAGIFIVAVWSRVTISIDLLQPSVRSLPQL